MAGKTLFGDLVVLCHRQAQHHRNIAHKPQRLSTFQGPPPSPTPRVSRLATYMSHSRPVGSVEVDDPRELISGEQPGIAAVASKRISPVSPSRPRYPHFGPRLFSAPFEFGHCFAPPASVAFTSRRSFSTMASCNVCLVSL